MSYLIVGFLLGLLVARPAWLGKSLADTLDERDARRSDR